MNIHQLVVGHVVLPNAVNPVAEALAEVAGEESTGKPRYYLLAMEPGMGKTGALADYAASQKLKRYPNWSGLLVAMATRNEIRSFIDRAQLDASDYSIIIQDGHELGRAGRADFDNAPIILTTHAKLRHLCHGRKFADVSQYHFHGKPRLLRVWDEAFIPGQPYSVRKDTVMGAIEKVRPRAQLEAQRLTAFAEGMQPDMANQTVDIPLGVSEACKIANGIQESSLGSLGLLEQQKALLVNDGGHGLTLVGAHSSLPADFAPAVIMDASGYVKHTYNIMEEAGHLMRSDRPRGSYANLTINHLTRSASREAFANAKTRRALLDEVASVINQRSDEPWLVIHFMERSDDGYNLVEELKARITNADGLQFMHWGNHHGTNDYQSIRNIMVMGVWRQPSPAYVGQAIAAGHPMNRHISRELLKSVRRGETQHHLLQAICRGNARNWDGGVCGTSNVYLIGQLKDCGDGTLEQTFPDAIIVPWLPNGDEDRDPLAKIMSFIDQQMSDTAVASFAKRMIGDAMGYRNKAGALAKHMRKPLFHAWLRSKGYELTRTTVRRRLYD